MFSLLSGLCCPLDEDDVYTDSQVLNVLYDRLVMRLITQRNLFETGKESTALVWAGELFMLVGPDVWPGIEKRLRATPCVKIGDDINGTTYEYLT